MSSPPPPPSTGGVFQLGERIGSGSYSYVFQACETETGRIVALKKSRVSLKIQRTLIRHEADILQLVAGHPSIPTVFAYGQLEHFEYLAMELLGRSLGDIISTEIRLPLKVVLRVADQMLSALQHIHSHRIVHRDIKPNNIIAHKNDPSIFYLIDFGIARPCLPSHHDPVTHNLYEERKHLVGTLKWASLNAHNGVDLGPRDDLESLAYTLLFLLRGDLPWQTHCNHGTVLGQMAQVREKKLARTGAGLAHGHPPLFGQLLDYARGLEFNEPIDYDRFRGQFEALRQASSLDDGTDDTDPGGTTAIPIDVALDQLQLSHTEAHECPVEVGQLVTVQIISKTSIEGYSMQADDPSFWNNPALSSDEWRTSARPAIVVDANFDKWASLHKILVVSLGCGTPENGTQVVPVSAAPGTETAVPEPAWPMPETYCYAFPSANWFYCLPDQARVPAHWKISSECVRLLKEKLLMSPRCVHYAARREDPNPVARYESRMMLQAFKFFVNVAALVPADLCADNGNLVDWRGDRGWFDERVKIAKYRGWEIGWHWTGGAVHDEDRVPNSYFDWDISQWADRQQERDLSLTLDEEQKEGLRRVQGEKGGTGEIREVVSK